jgi:hypothetical protein
MPGYQENHESYCQDVELAESWDFSEKLKELHRNIFLGKVLCRTIFLERETS